MNRRDLQFLQSQHEYPSVTIVVKTHRSMPEVQQDPIRIKNALTAVKERLKHECEAADYKKIEKQLKNIADALNYEYMLDGLAIFVNKNIAQFYKLPVEVVDSVTIDNTFNTRDIVHAINRIPRYWVLALSGKPTRLYYGIGQELNEIIEPAVDVYGVEQDGFPYEYILSEKEPYRDVWNGMRVDGDVDNLDEKKKKFFERVDHLLSRFTSVDQLPVVLVGTKKNCTLFKEVAPECKVVAEVDGDFSHEPAPTHVAQAVWPHVEKYLDAQAEKKIEAFTEAIGKMHHAFGIDAVWRAAQEGRVHELLIEEGFSVPGMVNKDNKQDLIIYGNAKSVGISDDLVNLLMELVMEKGGSVTFCKPHALAEYDHIAAILRY